MAEVNTSNSNTAMVVIFVLAIMAALAFFFLYQGGYIGGNHEDKRIDMKVEMPSAPAPSAPAPSAPAAPAETP